MASWMVHSPDERRNPHNDNEREGSGMSVGTKPYHLVDFADVPGVPCPCGTARRAFADVDEFPGTVHVTEISADAKLHYHRRLTETYFFLECGPGARMQLDDDLIPVKPGICIMIPPGVRHRAIGRMKVLILALPKFDPEDEWFD
jgi:mannose-6-phosphate isomerase-like protein (cupin superfamily)